MNLLNNNKSFEFFPVLDLKLLRDKQKDTVGLMGCNMQTNTIKNTIVSDINKNKSIVSHKNIVDLNSDLYFYTGLKQYYKINIKKDILSDYFLEKRKKLLYLDKEETRESFFLSGNSVFPVKNYYEFSKRRFILNLHNRNRLKTRETLVERHVHIINKLNKSLLSSLILKSYESGAFEGFKFFYQGKARNYKKKVIIQPKDRFYADYTSSKLSKYLSERDNTPLPFPEHISGLKYIFLGIPGFFVHKYSTGIKYDFVKKDKEPRFAMRPKIRSLGFLIKYLPNRPYLFAQYVLSNLNKKDFAGRLNIDNNLIIKHIIKEYIIIKLFLRFFVVHLRKAFDRRVFPYKWKNYLKVLSIVFNIARKVYGDIFKYVFRICSLDLMFGPDLKNNEFDLLKLNSLRIANMAFNTYAIKKMTIYPISFGAQGTSSILFDDFYTGSMTYNLPAIYERTSDLRYRKKPKVRRYKKVLMNFYYRNYLFSRRHTLLEKYNPDFYIELAKKF